MRTHITKRRLKRGSAAFVSVVLLAVLLAIGVIVGAVALRDHLVQELGDAAVALDHLDQSFSYTITIDPDGPGGQDPHVCTASYQDFTNTPPPLADDPNMPPAGIMFVAPSGTESPVDDMSIPGTIP